VPPTVLLDRANPEFLARAHDVYADLRALDPVVRAFLGSDFSAGAHPGGSPESQAHRASAQQRLRKLVQPNFTARAMDALKPCVQRLVDELLDKAERAAAEPGETAPERRMDFVEAVVPSTRS
jgi:cytochrome P450